MKFTLKHAVLASLLAGAGFAALAQGMGGPMGDWGGSHHEGMRPGMHQRDPAKMQEFATKRLAEAKAKLKIGAEQEAAWATFSAAMMPPANPPKRPDRAEMEKLSTPERIDRMQALRTAREAEMDKRANAVKALYAVLNPEQKKVFDGLRMHHGRRGEHGPHAGK